MSTADRVFAWTIAAGEGLVVFMVTWLIAARLMERLIQEPLAASVAMALALGVGAVACGIEGVRRSATLRRAACPPSP